MRLLHLLRKGGKAGVLGAALGATLYGLGGLPVRGAVAAERPYGVVDLHVDLVYRHIYKGKSFARGLGEFRAETLRDVGVVGVVLPLFVPEWASPAGAREQDYERSYGLAYERILETPPYALPGCGVGQAGTDLSRSVQTWFAFEGAAHLEPSDAELAKWMLRGVRSFGLVHTAHNVLGTSSGKKAPEQHGLTARGRELVTKLQELGGIVDVSHASDPTTDAVLGIAADTGAVVIATHSNARALAAHPRNLTDAQIRAIGRSGGVVGINFHQPFLSASGRADLKDVVAQILHVRKIAGVRHVALGSDFEGGIRPVAELVDASRYQVLAQALREAGLPPSEVSQVMGGNALRVLCGAFFSGRSNDRNASP